mgnify:CR=1 FL=1
MGEDAQTVLNKMNGGRRPTRDKGYVGLYLKTGYSLPGGRHHLGGSRGVSAGTL